jgi:hypothetical protein
MHRLVNRVVQVEWRRSASLHHRCADRARQPLARLARRRSLMRWSWAADHSIHKLAAWLETSINPSKPCGHQAALR